VKPSLRILLLPILCVYFTACNREQGNIVIDGQGQGNQMGLNITDTLTLLGTTIDEDSLPSKGLSYALVGEINDPVFGKSKSSLFADLNLVEPNNNFPNTQDPDSAVLFIPAIAGLQHYGDRNFIHRLKIAPITENISSDSVYFQNQSFPVDDNLATYYNGQLINEYNDSVKYRKIKLAPYNGIKVKLSASFAKFLMNMPKEAYETNANLDKYFKGIAIIPENGTLSSGQGSFAVWDIQNVLSTSYRAKIMLYYDDTSTFLFSFSGKSSAVSQGLTGPYHGEIDEQLKNPNKNYDKTFAQALGGVKTKVTIPYLYNLVSEGNVAIQRAEIEFFPIEYNENYFVPPRLNLYKPLNAGSTRNYLLKDALVLTNYGGSYNTNTRSYKFEITRHLQEVLNDSFFNHINTNLGLYLAVPADQPVIGARAIFDHTKTKLHLIYTKPN
jgi:hypothetical protein